MRNASAVVIACLLAAALGAGVIWHFTHRGPDLPDPPALVLKVREVARLETLDVSLYKKLDFSPDPRPTGSTWGDVAQWASYSLRPPRGRAIIFADAHLSIDLRKLTANSLRVTGRKVEAVLPATQVQVELKPAETEIIGSNLDSKQTAELFERARTAFEREVQADPKLAVQARSSAEQTLRSLFVGLGFTEVEFVKELPAPARG
ncbi:MAG: DUF4230 domain-containing protein [Myxococcales bacterium]